MSAAVPGESRWRRTTADRTEQAVVKAIGQFRAMYGYAPDAIDLGERLRKSPGYLRLVLKRLAARGVVCRVPGGWAVTDGSEP